MWILKFEPSLALTFFAILTNPIMEPKSKEELCMKNFIKFGLVGLAGYFVGFYEMKYRNLKLLVKNMAKRLEEKNSEEEGEKEEP